MGSKSAPLLSIVTITYNDPEALSLTLDSLEPLSFASFAWEQIIVDSSPEKNAPRLAQLAQTRRFCHLKQAPAGIYPAMNAGLKECRGAYVWFLNSGDRLKSASDLERALAEFGQAKNFALGLSSAELMRDGKIQYVQRPRSGIGPLLGINRICHQALLFRRKIFEKLGPFSEDYKIAADYEFHLRAKAEGLKTISLDATLTQYDMGGQSSQMEKVFADFAKIHRDLRRQGKLSYAPLHGFIRRIEWIRIHSFKTLGSTPIGPSLRAIWRKTKQFGSRKSSG